MELLTIDNYFNVLEKCTLEAFESLKLKNLYPKDGTKPFWAVGNMTIEKNGLLTENDKILFRDEYIKENLRVTFLTAIERFCKDYEARYLVKRDFFYKKCYEALLYKFSQSEHCHKPDFGFKVDLEPCVLTFIWNMRNDIEARCIHSQKIENKSKLYNSNDVIINLHLQLSFILKRIKENLKQNYYIENYLICESEIAFLDYFNLMDYVTNQDIKNSSSLFIICDYCKQVVDLWNKDLLNIPIKKLKEPFNYIDEINQRYYNSIVEFNCLLLENKKTGTWFNTLHGKEFFLKTYEYNFYSLSQIANKCKEIFNYLYISFDEIKSKFEHLAPQPEATIEKGFTKEYWFIIGLKFATGEMSGLLIDSEQNFTKVATQLGNKNYRPFISETFNNTTESDKNIYSKPKKLKVIYDYCNEKEIVMTSNFIDIYNTNELK